MTTGPTSSLGGRKTKVVNASGAKTAGVKGISRYKLPGEPGGFGTKHEVRAQRAEMPSTATTLDTGPGNHGNVEVRAGERKPIARTPQQRAEQRAQDPLTDANRNRQVTDPFNES